MISNRWTDFDEIWHAEASRYLEVYYAYTKQQLYTCMSVNSSIA